MSDRAWPEDPMDPRCPHCDGPVSATSSFCMHCEADLPPSNFGAAEPAGTTTSPAETTAEMTRPDPGMPTAETPVERSGWLDPDGTVDDVSTAAVGVVGGLLVGFLLLLLAIWAFPRSVQSSWGTTVGVVGWLLATVWMAKTRTVFGAVRKAAYSLGALLALVPLFVAYALADPNALWFGVVLWPVGAIVAGVGWIVGRGALEADEG